VLHGNGMDWTPVEGTAFADGASPLRPAAAAGHHDDSGGSKRVNVRAPNIRHEEGTPK
jgi:hypothetical protein